MKKLWLIVAVVLAAVAAVCMWRGNFDAAFVAAVLGCVAWFLNFRMQAKTIVAASDAEEEERNHTKDFSEDMRDLDDVQ